MKPLRYSVYHSMSVDEFLILCLHAAHVVWKEKRRRKLREHSSHHNSNGQHRLRKEVGVKRYIQHLFALVKDIIFSCPRGWHCNNRERTGFPELPSAGLRDSRSITRRRWGSFIFFSYSRYLFWASLDAGWPPRPSCSTWWRGLMTSDFSVR